MTDKTELEVTQEPCMACGGDGQDGTAYVGQFPCHACGGTGVVKQSLTTEPLSKTEQFDLDELKLWADDECPEGVSGIPDQVRELITFARQHLATRTPDPTPVAWMYGRANFRLTRNFDSSLSATPLYAHPPAVHADGLVDALEWYADQMCEGLCQGKDPKVCAAIGADNCAGCPAVVALAAHRGEA